MTLNAYTVGQGVDGPSHCCGQLEWGRRQLRAETCHPGRVVAVPSRFGQADYLDPRVVLPGGDLIGRTRADGQVVVQVVDGRVEAVVVRHRQAEQPGKHLTGGDQARLVRLARYAPAVVRAQSQNVA